MPTDEQFDKILHYATDVRKFEIGLFWQRSLFFWGFIGASFVAYAELAKSDNDNQDLQLAVACFGFVCSVAWTLLNRGSKYWQEYWEREVEQAELKVLGYPLFSRDSSIQPKGWWLQARQYSVSKLAIALSDFTILVWSVLAARAFPCDEVSFCWSPSLLMPIGAVLFACLMLWSCRSSPREKKSAESSNRAKAD